MWCCEWFASHVGVGSHTHAASVFALDTPCVYSHGASVCVKETLIAPAHPALVHTLFPAPTSQVFHPDVDVQRARGRRRRRRVCRARAQRNGVAQHALDSVVWRAARALLHHALPVCQPGALPHVSLQSEPTLRVMSHVMSCHVLVVALRAGAEVLTRQADCQGILKLVSNVCMISGAYRMVSLNSRVSSKSRSMCAAYHPCAVCQPDGMYKGPSSSFVLNPPPLPQASFFSAGGVAFKVWCVPSRWASCIEAEARLSPSLHQL